jgi:hypothetical protein
MATSYQVLGQSAPTANTLTSVYTVPSSTEAVISTIAVCNLGSGPTTYSIAIQPNAESLADKHYIAYDCSIAPQDTSTLTIGITLNAADVVTVSSYNGKVAFNLFGSEIA